MLTQSALDAEIEAQLPTNFNNVITAAILRPVMHDMVAYTAQGPVSAFNVKAFGAKGDGVTDDSTAILTTVNAAYSAGGSVYFPAGTYFIAQSAVLTQTVVTSGHGLNYYGEGSQVSILLLDVEAASTDHYFYDNGSTPRMLDNRFFDLGFIGHTPGGFSGPSSIRTHAKGFRQWATSATGSHEQNFCFTRCEFGYLNNVFETAGDNTTSENRWVQCDIYQIKNSVLSLNNVQSFNHEFHGTNLTDIYGSAFVLNQGGGGIKMYGGSVILDSDAGVDTWFVNYTISGAGGGGYPHASINGVRFEFRGNNTKLASLATTAEFEVIFNDCLLEDQGTINKSNFCTVGAYSHIAFNDCYFLDLNGGTTLYNAPEGNTYNQSGSIIFSNCALHPDWSDRCTVANYGRISARGCFGTNVGAAGGGQNYVHDFDARVDEPTPGLYTAWTSGSSLVGGPTDNNTVLKVANFLVGFEGWPNTGSGELQLKLPRNAVIKNIHLRKPSGGGSATVCTLNVSRNDKTGSPHLTSNSAAYNTPQTGDTTNYFYNVGTTSNERDLRLYTSVSTTSGPSGGFCIVEYY